MVSSYSFFPLPLIYLIRGLQQRKELRAVSKQDCQGGTLTSLPQSRSGDLRSYRNYSEVDDFVLARAIAGKEGSSRSPTKKDSPPNRREKVRKKD